MEGEPRYFHQSAIKRQLAHKKGRFDTLTHDKRGIEELNSMSKRQTTYNRNPQNNNEIHSINLIKLDEEIKKTEVHLDHLLMLRDNLFEQAKREVQGDQPCSYLC